MTNKMENKNDVTMEKNYTVYMHICPNGKVYIGITRQIPERRWANGYGYKPNEYFWMDIQKFGWENILHEVIEKNLTLDEANKMEIELIAKYKSNKRRFGYNIQSGGSGIGKMNEETKKKMIENNKNYKKVYCDNLIFSTLSECANYYDTNPTTLKNFIIGERKMPLNFQQLGLRFASDNDLNECERYDIKKHGNKNNVGINNTRNKIHCNGIIFKTIKECANYYGISRERIERWMRYERKMPLNFQQLGLRFASDNDLNECERYDIKKHGNKNNVGINSTVNFIYCDNLIFNSIIECANYYSIKESRMTSWLKGQNIIRSDFQQLGLRIATKDDLNTYPRYTPVNN